MAYERIKTKHELKMNLNYGEINFSFPQNLIAHNGIKISNIIAVGTLNGFTSHIRPVIHMVNGEVILLNQINTKGQGKGNIKIPAGQLLS